MDIEEKSPLYTHFLETLEGLVTIRAFKWQDAWNGLNSSLLDRSQRPYYLLHSIQRWLNLVLDLIVVAVATLIVVLVTQLPHYSGGGALGVALISVISMNTSLAYLIDAWTQLETSLGAIARIKTFESTVSSENTGGGNSLPPPGWPNLTSVRLSNVSASYSPAATPILKNVTMSINSGQKVAIVGRSGSGKSTLLLVLLRLLDLSSGSITIGDIDTTTLTREFIRAAILTIPQEPLLLKGTVRFNLTLNTTASDAAITHTLQKVGLWALISARGGLDASIDACPMSQGQQQLFSFARVLLRRGSSNRAPGIVLLDEFAASVDPDTETMLMRLLWEEFADCTVVAVTHRLQSVREFDTVGFVDEGRLVEFESPQVLLERDSAFLRLCFGAVEGVV
ncbi:hypothetical protein G7Y79_00047g083030 [Physcia stellaris]|nr:hypothetical protein G7Y79_00047g083030 [Physcia stellaris]